MAIKCVRVTPQAERDLDSAVIYLASEAEVETALRFFDAAHDTFREILTMPGMGRMRPVRNPQSCRNSAMGGFRLW